MNPYTYSEKKNTFEKIFEVRTKVQKRWKEIFLLHHYLLASMSIHLTRTATYSIYAIVANYAVNALIISLTYIRSRRNTDIYIFYICSLAWIQLVYNKWLERELTAQQFFYIGLIVWRILYPKWSCTCLSWSPTIYTLSISITICHPASLNRKNVEICPWKIYTCVKLQCVCACAVVIDDATGLFTILMVAATNVII